MAQTHDYGAELCGSFILDKIRANDSRYRQIFSSSTIRIGDFDWPRPDFVIQDLDTSATYALEYKPPMQSKREYLCGLGQSIAYLQHHTYSGLIIPRTAEDGYNISDFISGICFSELFKDAPLSLFVYNDNFSEIEIIKPIVTPRSDFSARRIESSSKTFWCWWRDMSFSDLYTLLRLSFEFNSKPNDIYTDYIYPRFWEMLINGECFDFEMNVRQVSNSEKSKTSLKQNYRIPLVQLGLCTSRECRLTKLGFDILSLGTRYGCNSEIFISSLAYLVLTVGKHLDLINFIEKFQNNNPVPQSSRDFKIVLENDLTQQGFIGKRKPTAITTNAKASYIRDEFKLWNKFGLLIPRNTTSYFFPHHGLKFNWEKITNILTNFAIKN